jgi:hypothetical protein
MVMKRKVARMVAGVSAALCLVGFVSAGNASAAAAHRPAWHLIVTPSPAGSGPGIAAVRNGALIADSCASPAACTAVGVRENSAGTDVTLAEGWNGTSWRIQG